MEKNAQYCIGDLTMIIRPVNPVAKAMAQNRRRQQVVPDKKKYNRKKDKSYADTIRENESK
jgi:hypothetical protein